MVEAAPAEMCNKDIIQILFYLKRACLEVM